MGTGLTIMPKTLLHITPKFGTLPCMSTHNLTKLPVIIVGKDRTRMTCAVIDALKAHIKNAAPYFICVSDRSREGHDKIIENHLKKIGVSGYQVIRTLPEENRYGWGAAMNLGLSCAFDVCHDATCALVVDNDWILQKDLDIEKYLYAFMFSDIGAITFKPIHEGTNIRLEDIKVSDGSIYSKRVPVLEGNRISFTAELGCILITRSMFDAAGAFKENCITDETEWSFCNWYNSLTPNQKTSKHIWFATDKSLYHTELNGEGHVFTHIGINSQHPGPQKWNCPEEYKYLSDDSADEQVCKGAVMNRLLCVDEIEDEKDDTEIILWKDYFDKIYCFHYLPQEKKLGRLMQELTRVGIINSGIFEFRYTTPSKNDQDLCDAYKQKIPYLTVGYVNEALELRRILTESIHFKYSRILILEDDVAFLRDKSEIKSMLNKMPVDAGLIQFDKFINDGIPCEIYSELLREKPEGDCYVEYKKDSFTSSACFALSQEGMKDLLALCDDFLDAVDQYFKNMKCKKYLAVPNMCVQVHYKQSVSGTFGNIEYMHKVYRNCGVDYSHYAVPDGYDYGSVYDGESDIQNPDNNKKTSTPLVKKGKKYISVYAIAKNEASVAARWYDCVKEADEVCVLDTGSTDETVEILRSLGAKVTVKTYDDWSFAVARNDSMKLVSPESEILFTLDLDETIAPGWRKMLEEAWVAEEIAGNAPVGVAYKYIWSFDEFGRELQSFAVRKIHKKGTGKWKYRCHELLKEVDGNTIFIEGFVVEHHQNRQTDRGKYLGLLEKDAKEMPEDDRSAYYYARELMYAGRWNESIEESKRHLMLGTANWTCERAACMRNIASCYKELKKEDEYELWLWKAAEEDKTNREATYFLGELAMSKKDYRTAVKVFERCLAIKEPSLSYITIPLVWGAKPWFLYAQALWWTGKWQEAVAASKTALEIEPNNIQVQRQASGMEETAHENGVL